MRVRDLTIEQRINTVLLVWSALLSGIVIFAIVALYMVELEQLFETDMSIPFAYITPPLTLLMAFLGKIVYDRKTIKDDSIEESAKAIHFRENSITKYAIWEGAAFLNIITYMITQDRFYLIFLGAIMLLYIINYPSRNRFVMDYNIKEEQV
jgi:hypothetical protein